MVLLSLNMIAQIDLNDRNWECVLDEEFSTIGRTWDTLTFYSSDGLWRGYPGSGVTHGNELMVYQFSQCCFDDTNHMMRLVAQYDRTGRIPRHDYYLPSWMWQYGYPNNDSLFYFSGEIDCKNLTRIDTGCFRYGYFEIRCKLPTHRGASPAFWLYGANGDSQHDKFYEEIDVFEYSWWITDPTNPLCVINDFGSKRTFSTGYYFNDTASILTSYARKYPIIPLNSPDLESFHTFGCKWLPDSLLWYFDGNIVNEYNVTDSIPHRHLTLKANYAIDKYALLNNTVWMETDEMVIDYIKVYQLNWDCNTAEVITQQSDLDNFYYAVKRSISIAPSPINRIKIRSNEKVTFRATSCFEITGSFCTENECDFTVIMQSCPND